MTEKRTMTCECGTTYETQVYPFGSRVLARYECDACYEARLALAMDRDAAMERWRRLEHWRSVCPADYQDTDLARLPAPPDAVQRVMRWSPVDRGMVIHGPIRVGKTRTLWALARRIYVELGTEVEIYRATELARKLAASFERPAGHDRLMDELMHTPVLAIDDVDKVRMTPRMQTDLFDLVDGRCASGRPVILTTNLVGDSIVARFDDEITGRAFVQRLREYCEAVSFQEE